MIQRIIKHQIVSDLFSGKVIIITGPRQVGKTDQRQMKIGVICGKVFK